MKRLLIFLKKMLIFIRREKLFKLLFIIAFVILSGSMAFLYFEQNLKFTDALWWSVVTLTTVGYGDISPATTGGRFVGMAVMIIGIGFLGVLTATIATVLIENRLLENRGMKSTEVTDHFIVCGWNFRGNEIVAELRADKKTRDIPLVVIADISEKPVDDPRLHFIRGESNKEILQKANPEGAKVAIVLSDDRLDAYSRDAKTILNTLTIKNLNPDIYTCVELMDPKNVEHCQMAKADEIIVVGEFCTNLLVQAALDHGITRMVSELVSNRYGVELYKINLPQRFANQNFFETMCELKKEHGILCLGVEDSAGKNLVTNPENDYRLNKNDQLIVIASKRPDIT